MRKVLAVLVSALAVLTSAPPAAAQDAQWQADAAYALAAFAALDNGHETAFAYASAAQAAANLEGWDSPDAQRYLDALHGTRLPGGGYGLGYPYDAFGDHTVNPAGTVYTVTLADHVGPVLLDAYRHGSPKVTRDELVTLGNLLVAMPRLTFPDGTCIAYDDAATDHADDTFCVHNPSAAAAMFLAQLRDAGIYIAGSPYLAMAVTRHEVGSYDAARKLWLYDGKSSTYVDEDHNSLDAEAALTFAPALGYDAVTAIMNRSLDATSWLAHLRLAALACSYGPRWYGEFTAHQHTIDIDPVRAAQVAKYASRDALACP